MKRTIIAAALALAFALPVAAQNDAPTYYAQQIVVPLVAEGGVSNALAQVIDVRKQQNVALQINVTSVNVTNATWRFSGSVDGSVWQTNRYNIGIPGGVVLPVPVILTNIAVGPIGYLRLDSVSTLGPGTLTNTMYYGVKISSP